MLSPTFVKSRSILLLVVLLFPYPVLSILAVGGHDRQLQLRGGGRGREVGEEIEDRQRAKCEPYNELGTLN
jgi:hypothetical protein